MYFVGLHKGLMGLQGSILPLLPSPSWALGRLRNQLPSSGLCLGRRGSAIIQANGAWVI